MKQLKTYVKMSIGRTANGICNFEIDNYFIVHDKVLENYLCGKITKEEFINYIVEIKNKGLCLGNIWLEERRKEYGDEEKERLEKKLNKK